MLILSHPDSQPLAQQLANRLGLPLQQSQTHEFPDGETRLRLPAQLPRHIILVRSLDQPNQKLIELLLSCKTARAMGVERITLVAPYLCYMRQDVAFQPGECVSQKIIGELIAELVDDLITVDPHLHRTPTLQQAVPVKQAITLSAVPAISDFIKKRADQPLLLGPDSESEQWVNAIAQQTGLTGLVAHKQRRGDHDVTITLAEADYRDRKVVIIDDIVSTGGTLIHIAQLLKRAGAQQISCAITHPLFVDDSYARLQQAGFQQIWSSNTISHPSNAIDLTETLASALEQAIL